MLTRSMRRLITVAALTLAALAASTSSASALETTAPTLTPKEVTDFYVRYDVVISASSNMERTRWQAVLKVKSGKGEDFAGINYTDWSTDREDRWTWTGGELTLYPDDTYSVWAEWNVYTICLGNPACIDNGTSPSTGVTLPENLHDAEICKGVPGCIDRTTDKDEDGLSADAGGPYTVKRGGTVKLNGSKSKGKIKDYEWKFIPKPDRTAPDNGPGQYEPPICEKPRADAEKKGKRAEAVALCELTAVLTVRDKKGNTDTDTADIRIKARKLGPIKVKHQPKAKPTEGKFSVVDNICECFLGRNIPTRDAAKGKTEGDSHFIDGGRDDLLGYRVAKVKDKGGPYNGYHYVKSHSLKIDRTALVQAELFPGTRTRRENDKQNAQRKKLGLPLYDPATVYRSVLAHEKVHTTLMQEKLSEIVESGNDPVEFIEGLVFESEKTLEANANSKIGDADTAIGTYALNEDTVHARLEAQGWKGGFMLAPLGSTRDFTEWTPPSLALLG